DEEKLTALAMRILQRKIARKWREAQQELKLRDGLAQDQPSGTEPPDDAARAVENADVVRWLMRYMNETEKALVELLRQGHTITSAAGELGLTPAYARVLLGRMKVRLGTTPGFPEGFP